VNAKSIGVATLFVVAGCFSEGDGASAVTTGAPGSSGDDTTAGSAPGTSGSPTSGTGADGTGTSASASTGNDSDSGDTTAGADACPPAAPDGAPRACGDGIAGPGELCFAGTLKLDTFAGTGSDLEIVDLNGDDHPDILAANLSTTSIYAAGIALGDGEGGFDTFKQVAYDGPVTDVQPMDLDGDEFIDLVLGTESSGMLMAINDGAANFAVDLMGAVLIGQDPILATADYTSDGLPDILACARGFPYVDVYPGDGLGTVQMDFGRRIDLVDEGPCLAIAVADLDGNDPIDVVVVTLQGQVQVAYGVASGSTFSVTVADHELDTDRPLRVATADVDGDGDVDLATADGSVVRIYLNEGIATFTEVQSLPAAPEGARDLIIADFDRDTRLDLAVSMWSNHTVRIFQGLGDGNFTPGPEFNMGNNTGPSRIAAGLLNDDCVLDFATANVFDETVSLRLTSP
jgi:hypothetical protein